MLMAQGGKDTTSLAVTKESERVHNEVGRLEGSRAIALRLEFLGDYARDTLEGVVLVSDQKTLASSLRHSHGEQVSAGDVQHRNDAEGDVRKSGQLAQYNLKKNVQQTLRTNT